MREYRVIISKEIKKNMYIEDRRFTVYANNTKQAKEIARKNLNSGEVFELKERVIYGVATLTSL